MMITETIKANANVWEKVRERARAFARRLSPAVTVRARNENEFIFRMTRMAALAAGAAALSLVLPSWRHGFWSDGALLGAALTIGAIGRRHPVVLFLAGCLGAVFGAAVKGFGMMGLPYIGVATMGMGVGLFMPWGKSRLNGVFGATIAALVGAWAVEKMGPAINSALPFEPAFALNWAIMGLFVSLGALPGHLAVIRDPVLAKVRKIRRKLTSEYYPYIDRALDKYLELGGIVPEKLGGPLDSIITRREFLSDALLEISDLTLALQDVDKLVSVLNDESLDEREKSLRERRGTFRDADMKREIDKVLLGIERSRKSSRKLRNESERLRFMLSRVEMDMVSNLPGR